jgi:hypothetical protein
MTNNYIEMFETFTCRSYGAWGVRAPVAINRSLLRSCRSVGRFSLTGLLLELWVVISYELTWVGNETGRPQLRRSDLFIAIKQTKTQAP